MTSQTAEACRDWCAQAQDHALMWTQLDPRDVLLPGTTCPAGGCLLSRASETLSEDEA